MLLYNQKGVTLIELLLVLGLIGIVIAIGWNAFASAQTSWDRLQTRLEAEAAVRHASQAISYELNLASFLEIRQVAHNWTDADIKTGDRLIFVDNGALILREKASSGYIDRTIADMERGTLQVSFTKPLNKNDGNNPHAPIANSLNFTVTALDNSNKVVYSLDSAIMLSNMLPDTGVPISDISLYSKAKNSNYIPGDRILYRTKADPFNPEEASHDAVGCY